MTDHSSTEDGASPVLEIRTFLVADIRGYTRFTLDHGDEAAGRLAARFAAVADDVIERHNGAIVELRGDEILAVFGSTRRALCASVALQSRFLIETRADPSLPLAVGIGMDAGEAVPVSGGFRGSALNLAARLCSRSGPGEILVSQHAVHLAGKVDGIRYETLNRVRFKGMPEPVRPIRVTSDTENVAGDVGSLLRRHAGPSAPWKRPRMLLIAGATALLLGVAPLFASALRDDPDGGRKVTPSGDGSHTDRPTIPEGLVKISPDLDRVVRTQRGLGGAVDVGFGSVWVEQVGKVLQIDPDTGSVTRTLRFNPRKGGPLAVGSGAVWVAGCDVLTRIDPHTNEMQRFPWPRDVGAVLFPPTDLSVEHGCYRRGTRMIAGGGALWITNTSAEWVARVDLPLEAVKLIRLDTAGGCCSHPISFGFGSLWAVSHHPGRLSRLDAETGEIVQKIPLSGNGDGVLAAEGSVWVLDSLGGTLTEIAPSGNRVVSTAPVPSGSLGLASGAGSLWLLNPAKALLYKFDPDSYEVVATIEAGLGSPFLTFGEGHLWLGDTTATGDSD